MKKTLLSFCFSLFLLSGHLANATCTDCNNQATQASVSSAEKIYLQNHQIIFQDAKIFVDINGTTCAVPAIFSDEAGYFVLVYTNNLKNREYAKEAP